MPAQVEITEGGAENIQELRPIFLALHDHHRSISKVALTEPDQSAWDARASTYDRHFRDRRALLYLARDVKRCIGYAFAVLCDGSSDTFPLGAGYAELYTLAVLPEWRGAGIGSALLDAVDVALADAAIPSLTVAVMAENEAAIRFYRRRGLVPGELILYRIGEPPTVGG